MTTQQDYDLSERENANLRAILAYCVTHLAQEYREAVAAMLDRDIDEGGAVEDSADDRVREHNEIVATITALVTHVEPLMREPRPDFTLSPHWHARLDHLLCQARGYELKRPLMRRVGNYPNVYAPVRKGEV